jgi:hypothetical protein
MGNLSGVGGLLRCVECGEVHWNLRLSSRGSDPQECRVCGSELKAEPRRTGRRFQRAIADARDAARPGDHAGLGPSATS